MPARGARVVYKTSRNTVVRTSPTAKSCTLNQTVQVSVPTTNPGSIEKVVLEVWNGADGAKSTRTYDLG
ncbi:hypothetical protein [Cryptosporangium aurantiacum]|uniref:hypothetical protein n=1 Tax=Cryptosporangium aurantiacum TaxID=134849 RepID=UPI0011613A80|nr:hypothetical protein [Cryptosporangium aurantiacum]